MGPTEAVRWRPRQSRAGIRSMFIEVGHLGSLKVNQIELTAMNGNGRRLSLRPTPISHPEPNARRFDRRSQATTKPRLSLSFPSLAPLQAFLQSQHSRHRLLVHGRVGRSLNGARRRVVPPRPAPHPRPRFSLPFLSRCTERLLYALGLF